MRILLKTFAASFVLLFVLSLVSSFAFGQDTVTGAFEGNVTDGVTGQAIAGATAEITNVETGIIVTKTTDARDPHAARAASRVVVSLSPLMPSCALLDPLPLASVMPDP